MKYILSELLYNSLREMLGHKVGKKIIYATKEDVIKYINGSYRILGGITDISIDSSEKDGYNANKQR